MLMTDYSGYSEWKHWVPEAFMAVTPFEVHYFDGELRGLALKGARVLEIGFGNGNFFRYAMDRGATVSGTELIEQAVISAKQHGIRVYRTDLSDAIAESPGAFDLVTAFDVFEHLAISQITELFERLAALVKPGGHVLARFPNGQSPLGRVGQYADHTHRSVLSAPLLMHLLQGKPWTLVRAGNPFLVLYADNILKRIALHLRSIGRRIAETAVNRLYGLDITLDQNVTVLLRRL